MASVNMWWVTEQHNRAVPLPIDIIGIPKERKEKGEEKTFKDTGQNSPVNTKRDKHRDSHLDTL